MRKFLIAGIILVAIAIFIFLNYAPKELTDSEKQAALTNILGRKPVLTEKQVPKGNVEFKGKYLTFMYPASAKIYKYSLNGVVQKPSGIENLIFDIESPKISFFMEVIEVPITVQSLNDYPSVKLRQIQPGIYSQKEIIVDGKNGLSFEKKDTRGFEKTGFVYINGKVFTFSSQGSDSKETINLFEKILQSVKFL